MTDIPSACASMASGFPRPEWAPVYITRLGFNFLIRALSNDVYHEIRAFRNTSSLGNTSSVSDPVTRYPASFAHTARDAIAIPLIPTK